MNEPHPTHVGGELIHLVETRGRGITQLKCPYTAGGFTQIEELELIGRRWRKLGSLDVYTAHPVPVGLQALHEMAGDESPCTTNQSSSHNRNTSSLVFHVTPALLPPNSFVTLGEQPR